MPRIFMIEGSLVSLNTAGDTPVWSRPSPVNLERTIAGSLQLYPIESNHPAISYEDGSFLLEPGGSNLLTWNMDLSQSVWVKGSPQVTVRTDYAGMGENAPDGTPTSDRLRWDTGTGDGQKLVRTLKLEAEAYYTLSAIFRLRGGSFGANDYMRVAGNVVSASTNQVGLSYLNDYSNQYVLLTTTFKVSGRQPVLPGNNHQIKRFAITNVSQSTLTLTLTAGMSAAANDWVGGQVQINGQFYLITANTATTSSSQSVTVTVSTSNLVSNGVTTSMFAALTDAPSQDVSIELYSERTASIDWGGMQLEKRPFRTSMIYQDGKIETRAKSLLYWRKSPIANLKSFALYLELKEWRGDGNVIDMGNLTATITGGKLVIVAGTATLSLSDALPAAAKIMIQVSAANSSISVYVNGVLKGRATTSNFAGQTNVPMILNSEGLRCWQRIIIYDEALLEGQVDIGGSAKLEIKDLFDSKVPIDSVAISAHAPLINLPPVTVPGKAPSVAETVVTSIDTGTGSVTVKSATGFLLNTPVELLRGDYRIAMPTITAISGSVITLSPFPSAALGDILVFGRSLLPGSATVRFPFDAVDPQIITAVNTGLKRLTISGALAWKQDRALVRTPLYEDVAEVAVLSVDTVNSYLFVDDVSDIQVGCTISQPRFMSELRLPVEAYFAGLTETIPGVDIATIKGKWLNGLKIENWNPYPATVTPYIRPYL